MTIETDNSRPGVDVDTVLRNLRLVLAHDEISGHHSSEMAALETLVRAMARDGVQRDQPMREVFARIGDKWSTLLLQLPARRAAAAGQHGRRRRAHLAAYADVAAARARTRRPDRASRDPDRSPTGRRIRSG